MIHLEAVDKHYISAHRSLHVIDTVTLSIPEGSFFTLVGPSGSGKTTTLRLIAGLERHEDGRIRFGERVVSDPRRGVFVPASRRGIGMVFQSYAIWPHMDVFDNVVYPLRHVRPRLTRAEMDHRVLGTLELVGLAELVHSPAPMLSGGQQQRVALARALVSQPEVLLLDEPLSNLDAKLRERMRLEIRDLQRRLGITTVYVTHDRAEALSMSTEVAVMNQGRIEMVGTPSEIYERPATLFTAEFLGQCNVIAGRITKVGPSGNVTVDSAYGPLSCDAPLGCDLGELVDIILRPSDVCLTPAEDAANKADPWRGTLSNAAYYGENIDCIVDLPGGQLRALAPSHLWPYVGKPVSVAVTAKRLSAIPAIGRDE